MRKKLSTVIIMTVMALSYLSGCGSTAQETSESIIQTESIAQTETMADTKEADKYYEAGRAALYGLDGTEMNLETAYNSFVKAKELGKNDANLYLGLLCDRYSYPNKDYETAKAYYEECADNPYALTCLGFLYMNGNGVQEDTEKAKEIFNQVIGMGCVEGYLGIAELAYDDEDYSTALEYFKKVLESSEQIFLADAMNDVGVYYYYGYVVEQDYATALEWLEKAANLGSINSMYAIGVLYNNGYGVEQDYTKALEWYEKAADLGDENAMNNIGWMYYNGLGVKQDFTKALEWYEKSADLGCADAINNIGWMYDMVYGDYTKALEWYQKAADLGQANAMDNLAYIYYDGLGVEKDYAKSLEWYEKAANLGHENAMYNCGYMYEYGIGVEKDYAKALEWYEKAATSKDAHTAELAKQAIQRLK